MIQVVLCRGVSSKYYIATVGYKEIYGDEEGIIAQLSESLDFEHPAYHDQWNIKQFDRETLELKAASVAEIANMAAEATKRAMVKRCTGKG